MIKQSTYEKLYNNKVAPLLEAALSPLKFKYSKSSKTFSRTVKGYKQTVSIIDQGGIIYNDKTEELQLRFALTYFVALPEYEKWHTEHLGHPANVKHFVAAPKSFVYLNFEDFSEEDFNTPSPAVQFKHMVTASLGAADPETPDDQIEINKYILEQLPTDIQQSESACDIDYIFEKRDFPLSINYIHLLAFAGHKEKAEEYYDKLYDYIINRLKESEQDQHDFDSNMRSFQQFQQKALKIIGKNYTNPYQLGIAVAPNQEQEIKLTSSYTFKESLRLKSTSIVIQQCIVNPRNGDILLHQKDGTLTKFNQAGKQLLEFKPAFNSPFSSAYDIIGCIEETGIFFVNNVLILPDNTTVRLAEPVPKKKSKKNDTPVCMALGYLHQSGKYYTLFLNPGRATIYNIYNSHFELLSSVELEGIAQKVFPLKEWAITRTKDNKNIFWDTTGNKLFELDFANGNDYIDIAASGRYMMSFFYSTKSQFYDLQTKEQKPLWAHPTYLKGYKENFYNDIHHNFGLSLARFSPDETYIVGAADHGKYVAWTLPDLKRVELIPSKEVFPYLLHPEIVELEGQTFLKNRGYGIRHIEFFDNASHFIMQMEDHIMVWNRKFENTGFLPDIGRLHVYGDNLLSQLKETEAVLYKRV